MADRSPQRRPRPGSTTDPDAIDRVVRKYAGARGLDRGYSAHSMRATSITTAIENGARLRMGRRPPGVATRARQSCMIGEGTIPRKRRRFSRPV
jgi:integrase/recombinase XerD